MHDLKDRYAELASEVRFLRDRLDILDCVNSYNRGLDRLDADLIRAAYHSDAIDQHGPFLGDREEFVPFAIECEAYFHVTHHGISSHNCQIDGDEAHAESYVHFFVLQPDKKTVGFGAGRYVDRLQRRDRVWAIAVRRFLMDITYEVPQSEWLGPEWSAFAGVRNTADASYARPLTAPTGHD